MCRARRTWFRRGVIPAVLVLVVLVPLSPGPLVVEALAGTSCPSPAGGGDIMMSGPRPPVTSLAPDPCGTGYALLDAEGGVFGFASMPFYGSVPWLRAAGEPVGPSRVIDMTATPSRGGYLLVDETGGVFSFGDAAYRGSLPALRAAGTPVPPVQIVEMAMTRSGAGYLMLDSTGGVFSFGDARYAGSLPQLRSERRLDSGAPAVDIAVTPKGGYLILDSPGGVFAFGSAAYRGSLPSLRQEGRLVGAVPATAIAVTPSGGGYIILDRSGGVFTFGDATYAGSAAGREGPVPAIDIELTPGGGGYWVLFENGSVHAFGDARDFGSLVGVRSAIAADLFERLNGERVQRGLPRLAWNGTLEAAANTWSARMASRGLQHGSWTLVDQSGYETLGENIGSSWGTAVNAGTLHSSWMNSDPHRAHILEPGFDSVGIGVACANGQVWATQVFSRRAGSSRPPVTQSVPPHDPIAYPEPGGTGC